MYSMVNRSFEWKDMLICGSELEELTRPQSFTLHYTAFIIEEKPNPLSQKQFWAFTLFCSCKATLRQAQGQTSHQTSQPNTLQTRPMIHHLSDVQESRPSVCSTAPRHCKPSYESVSHNGKVADSLHPAQDSCEKGLRNWGDIATRNTDIYPNT